MMMELLVVERRSSRRIPPRALLLLSFLAVSPGISFAQTSTEAPSQLWVSTAVMSTQTASATPLSLSITKSFTKSFTTSLTTSKRNSTSSSTSRPSEEAVPPPLFEPAGDAADPSDPTAQPKESVFNYYFLILVAFGVLVAVGLWWIRRRRKRRKEQMRLSGQHALARDLDGWVNTRRWIHGTWRHNQAAAFVRREEGLNEHGEAPPPYQPTHEAPVASGEPQVRQDPVSGLSIPLRTLSRDAIETLRPPEYRETDASQAHPNVRPSTATSQVTRYGSVGDHPNASMRDLLQRVRSHSNG